MGTVFVSYRRDDAASAAGRLRDRLIQRFGEKSVFMDVDTIELGVDFSKRIVDAIASCRALIAVIGPDWLGAQDASGLEPEEII